MRRRWVVLRPRDARGRRWPASAPAAAGATAGRSSPRRMFPLPSAARSLGVSCPPPAKSLHRRRLHRGGEPRTVRTARHALGRHTRWSTQPTAQPAGAERDPARRRVHRRRGPASRSATIRRPPGSLVPLVERLATARALRPSSRRRTCRARSWTPLDRRARARRRGDCRSRRRAAGGGATSPRTLAPSRRQSRRIGPPCPTARAREHELQPSGRRRSAPGADDCARRRAQAYVGVGASGRSAPRALARALGRARLDGSSSTRGPRRSAAAERDRRVVPAPGRLRRGRLLRGEPQQVRDTRGAPGRRLLDACWPAPSPRRRDARGSVSCPAPRAPASPWAAGPPRSPRPGTARSWTAAVDARAARCDGRPACPTSTAPRGDPASPSGRSAPRPGLGTHARDVAAVCDVHHRA